jgi:predicted Zn-dependent protease
MSSSQVETQNPKIETDLREIAQDIVRRAMTGGATAAECVVREGDEFSTLVRLGQVETLKESGSKSIGVRVFFGQRAASTYSSDFSRPGLDRMVESALELAKITSEDPFGGIPDASQLGSLDGELDLYHEDVYSLPGPDRIDYARRAEKAALDFDPRIKNSEGGSFDAATGHKVLANSHGFVGEYAARLLVLGGTHAEEVGCARKGWQDCGGTYAAPSGRAQGEDRASTDYFRPHGFDFNLGAHLRRGEWRFCVPRGVISCGQAGAENCGRQRQHHR